MSGIVDLVSDSIENGRLFTTISCVIVSKLGFALALSRSAAAI